MTNTRNELRSIAIEVNSLLSRYIVIHDAVFKFSLRKVIPLPSIFKAIDFGDLYNQAKQIIAELEKYNRETEDLIQKATQIERRFGLSLSEYCVALIETVSLLRDILFQLYLKSQNLSGYRLSEYNKQCDLYKKAASEYRSLGGRLNDVYSEFIQ